MGGELEKKTLEQNHNSPEVQKNGKSNKKNPKNKKDINESKTADTTKSNNVKRNEKGKKKKDKIQVIAKDKSEKVINYEKKVLELIKDKNKEKEDYDIIYDIISKHFFLQTLNHQAKEEIIIGT